METNPDYIEYIKMLSEMDQIKETLIKLDELITLHPEYKNYLETAKKYSNGQLNKFYDRIYEMASEEY